MLIIYGLWLVFWNVPFDHCSITTQPSNLQKEKILRRSFDKIEIVPSYDYCYVVACWTLKIYRLAINESRVTWFYHRMIRCITVRRGCRRNGQICPIRICQWQRLLRYSIREDISKEIKNVRHLTRLEEDPFWSIPYLSCASNLARIKRSVFHECSRI